MSYEKFLWLTPMLIQHLCFWDFRHSLTRSHSSSGFLCLVLRDLSSWWHVAAVTQSASHSPPGQGVEGPAYPAEIAEGSREQGRNYLDWNLARSLSQWASLIAQLLKNLPAMQETPVQFLGWEDLLEKGQVTHSSILGLPLWLSSAMWETWV